MEKILKDAFEYAKPYISKGKQVSYIKTYSNKNDLKVCASIVDKHGKIFEYGDINSNFTIMSIVKVILSLIVFENYDMNEIKKRINFRASDKPYNSLLDIEMSDGKKPANPFINSGALVMTYFIYNLFKNKSEDIIVEKIRQLANNNSISVDENLVQLNKNGGYANKAIIYSLQNNNIIPRNADSIKILDIYNKACYITVTTRDLANISYILSNNGKNIHGKQLITSNISRILRTLMVTAGTYEYSGDFAIEIGIPAKSGISGAIMATTNKGFGIASYCPNVDEIGNSIVGMKILEYISKELNLCIY